MKTVRAIFIPIDSRPVTYSFPQQLAAIAGLEVAVPPLAMMGGLGVPADCDALFLWLEDALSKLAPDLLIVCLDSLLYGGLVASRCSSTSLDEIMERLKRIGSWKKLSGGKTQILAQSSIMRIPHYNTSVTEPAYWQEYGAQIFQWSALKHKEQLAILPADSDLQSLEKEIPNTVLNDFLARRDRNFCVNQKLVKLASSKEIDYMVFSQDDTAAYGLNVIEKTLLESEAHALGADNVVAYAGTDETIGALMARWLIAMSPSAPKVTVHFSPEEGKAVVSKFEGQTIARSFASIVDVIGLQPSTSKPNADDDFAVVIHTAGTVQGDHLPSLEKVLDTSRSVRETIQLIEESPIPVVLCDVAYSNGADAALIDTLLNSPHLFAKLCAYAGWNTTNNTVGSALAMGVAAWHARLHSFDAREPIKSALFVRFLDDWAYQALVRPQLNAKASDKILHELMVPFGQKMAKALGLNPGAVTFKLPWKRTFEVEVDLPSSVKSANIVT
jgi:hypothetical protein